MPWTNEEVLVLIAEYEQRPVLWNAFLDGYKDRALKADTWAELAYVMQKDRHEVEKKVHALRVQFNEELRKLEKKRLAYGSDELPRSAWQYFDALSFIVAGCKKKKMTPHPQIMAQLPSAEGSQPLSFEEQAEALALTTSVATHDTSTSTTPHSTSTSSLTPGTSMINAKGSPVLIAQRKLPFEPRTRKHILERVFDSANKPKIDEYNTFSAYIASEFRALKSETVKKRLKRNILCALMRASEEDDAERTFPQQQQPPSHLFDSQNTISSAPSPRGSSSPTTSIDDHHMIGMQSVTNQMVGVIDNVLRNGRTEERRDDPSSRVAPEPYLMSPEVRPIKEEMAEFTDDEKSGDRAQSPDFPGVHVTLNEGPLPDRKRRRTQYEDVQSSNRSPHNYNDDAREAEWEEEEDLFGRYVAATIKKFPRRAKSIAKMRIQHVLFETEEGDRLGKEYSLKMSITDGN